MQSCNWDAARKCLHFWMYKQIQINTRRTLENVDKVFYSHIQMTSHLYTMEVVGAVTRVTSSAKTKAESTDDVTRKRERGIQHFSKISFSNYFWHNLKTSPDHTALQRIFPAHSYMVNGLYLYSTFQLIKTFDNTETSTCVHTHSYTVGRRCQAVYTSIRSS